MSRVGTAHGPGKVAQQKVADAAFAEATRVMDEHQDAESRRRAFELYGAAAKAGHPGAHFRLGLMFMHGIGTRRQIELAIHHFAMAAAYGDAEAEHRWRWLMALEGFLWSRARLFP